MTVWLEMLLSLLLLSFFEIKPQQTLWLTYILFPAVAGQGQVDLSGWFLGDGAWVWTLVVTSGRCTQGAAWGCWVACE